MMLDDLNSFVGRFGQAVLAALILVVIVGTTGQTANAHGNTFAAGLAAAQSSESATTSDRYHDTAAPTKPTHHDSGGLGGIDVCAVGCGSMMLPPDGPIVRANPYFDGLIGFAELVVQRTASPPQRPPKRRT